MATKLKKSQSVGSRSLSPSACRGWQHPGGTGGDDARLPGPGWGTPVLGRGGERLRLAGEPAGGQQRCGAAGRFLELLEEGHAGLGALEGELQESRGSG